MMKFAPSASLLLPLTLLATACSSSSTSPASDAGTHTDAANPKDSGPSKDAGTHTDGSAHHDGSTNKDAAKAGDGASEAATPDGASPGDAGSDAGAIGGDRPVTMHIPPSYVAGTPMPLVMMLHGYGATAFEEELYLKLTPLADSQGFIYAMPNGTTDPTGSRFWNATDACCNLYGSTVDDSSYLSGVITQIEGRYTVDPKRVFIVGHSNGAFMAYRMACDHADQVVAIASLAGAMWEDTSKCQPSAPVSMVEIHGTADMTIAYDGGVIGDAAFPSAPTTVSDWVTLDGCGATPDTTSPPLDLDTGLAGDETTVTKYATGCMPGGHAELWTINGGAHIPTLSTTFSPDVINFLFTHARP